MSDDETYIQGWDKIAAFFPMKTAQTVRKKYGQEMLADAWVFKSYVGRGKRPTVWSFPSMIQKFVAQKQLKSKKV